MIVARALNGLQLTPVEKVHALNPFSSGEQKNSKQPSFETIITTLLYPKEDCTDAPDSFESAFETYNAKGVAAFYSYHQSTTTYIC